MESVWEEKKIQALFSDLKAADEHFAPRFAGVWNRAQVAPRRVRAFNPAFVGVTVLLVCVLVSLAVWSRYSRRTHTNVLVATPTPTSTAPKVAATGGTDEIRKPELPRVIRRSSASKSAAQRRANLLAAQRKLTRDAKAITNWQSPTSTLLASSSDELLTSLPQLNEGASDLQSFLTSRPN